ncbi:MAG: hypothetical protein PHT84_03025 [Candidatus Pacebacteria bacterium]|nr:hypothetical protein [Candidatus Paceibacterota bacterium]
MENTFQTSFIPKKPITSTEAPKRKPVSLFRVLSFVLLLIMILSSVGLFVYKSYLIKQKENLSVSLSKIKDSFEQETIKDLELFDKRTSVAKEVLDGHIILSPMFNLLGELTIPSIQYNKFEHKTNEKGFFVQISGVARDYKSIALQADVFNGTKGRYFKNVIFSNLMKDKNNQVTFNLEFNVDPSLLSYENDILMNQNTSNQNLLINGSANN